MIQLQKVSRTYVLGGEAIHALDGVDLEIRDGSFTAIMGPSGSGKTTFLNLIGGLDQPDKGKVLVDGQDLARMKDGALSIYRNREVGFVFQAFHLQPFLTAEENVTLPLIFAKVSAGKRRQQARDMLALVGLADRARHRPDELSAGQRQRVSIARAMVNNPRIILADEPTGNLDSKNGRMIVELLRQLAKKRGATIVMVTHDPGMAKLADRVITIHDGRISS